ncbi:type IV pilus twitching motility protein PilT [Glaciibacter sp. 2TAF33]|uniref:type IV pilus twitching motility protein PilT n=1 Tax=Glaciibacter sp. 2TAF33 TaxID=3233015 RepID=UPI003F92C491
MDEPIYEIPVTPKAADAEPTLESLLAEFAAQEVVEPRTVVDPLETQWLPPSPTDPFDEVPPPTKVYSLDDYTSQGRAAARRAAVPTIAPQVARAEALLTDEERAALGNADPDLVAALEQVVLRNASDLHVTAGAAPSLRVDGGLRPMEGAERWMPEKVTAALFSLLLPDQRERFERELELDFAYTAGGARFRVNYYQQRNSVGAAFRLIPRDIKPLDELGVPASINQFAKLARGLVLVTGPTGSGKSTTLAALIDLVNRTRADHIVTVEDPIEFLHRHQKSLVNQREVGHDTHSFAAALKHVLRQDPDVILIGELRDLETISVALTAAETGHLVFATLHTQSAAQTIDRVIDVFPPHQQGQVRAQLAATLQGVVCQTLVKKASGSGRVVATEVLVTTPAIGNLIREGKTYQITSMMQAGRGLGMHTMDQHLADLVDSGQITREAALEKAQEPDAIGQLIQRAETPADDVGRAIASGGIDFGDSFSRDGH